MTQNNITQTPDYRYELLRTEGMAKRARVTTVHGVIETPVFMNVATAGAIKGGLSAKDLENIDTQVMLCNTYHLHVRTGDEIIRELGGLHRFTTWSHPILTDSGGFQVFSLTDLRKIFDECPPALAERDYVVNSVARTERWLLRSQAKMRELKALEGAVNPHQLLFGINQGAIFHDIRIENAKRIADMDLDGYAVGGLAVGETHEQMYSVLEAVTPYLPVNKPTYLMGVGTPQNILEGVARGIDFFDCVYPSRNGRHGNLYTNHGTLRIRNARFEKDMRPIDPDCGCPVCRRYSRAYIRHLLKADETLGLRLCVMHNLYFYNHLMQEIRDALDAGHFEDYKRRKLFDLSQDCAD